MQRKFKIFVLSLIVYSFAISNTGSLQDKEAIAKCFANHIEYYRNNPKIIDPLNYFSPYALKKRYKVTVDSMFYSPDSLMVFAFILIEKINQNENVFKYNSVALIGYRKEVSNNFEIYPVDKYIAAGFDTPQEALEIIKYGYCVELKDEGDRFDNKYSYNVGDKEFWSKSLFVQKFNGIFYFESYLGKAYHYIKLDYPKCGVK